MLVGVSNVDNDVLIAVYAVVVVVYGVKVCLCSMVLVLLRQIVWFMVWTLMHGVVVGIVTGDVNVVVVVGVADVKDVDVDNVHSYVVIVVAADANMMMVDVCICSMLSVMSLMWSRLAGTTRLLMMMMQPRFVLRMLALLCGIVIMLMCDGDCVCCG